MKPVTVFVFLCVFILNACSGKEQNTELINQAQDSLSVSIEEEVRAFTVADVKIAKAFLYDKYTLEDVYPYRDTTRCFQWEKIRERLFFLDSIQMEKSTYGILQNRRNLNGTAPLVKEYVMNSYKRVEDMFGVERHQSVPVYFLADTITPERYGRDGSLVKLLADSGNFYVVENMNFKGEWFIPKKYVKVLPDSILFTKAIFVDRVNQNIATVEKTDTAWLVRSMNPATTGRHHPPYQQETPVGLFVIQEKKARMEYYVDGTTQIGGFSPFASRFSNGGYIHGVPVDLPRTQIVEFSPSLGTTPRSHMCVRNATSHAEFVFHWAPVNESVVFVFD